MTPPSPLVSELAAALRAARRARGVSIAALAAEAGVSPRLISEFEQDKRRHVSLDTAVRLLQLMQVPLVVVSASRPTDTDHARAERAARRRESWTGSQTRLGMPDEPRAPATAAVRLAAVARASQLAVALQQAPQASVKRSSASSSEPVETAPRRASSRRL